jgi:hypothetical protein
VSGVELELAAVADARRQVGAALDARVGPKGVLYSRPAARRLQGVEDVLSVIEEVLSVSGPSETTRAAVGIVCDRLHDLRLQVPIGIAIRLDFAKRYLADLGEVIA